MQNELAVLYCSEVFNNKSYSEINKLILTTVMCQVFSETNNRADLILLMPLTTVQERSFSSLKRITSYTWWRLVQCSVMDAFYLAPYKIKIKNSLKVK